MKMVVALLLVILGVAITPATASELEVREEVRDMATALFLSEDFARLEALADDYRRTKSKTPAGVWHLALFYVGLVGGFQCVAHESDEGWKVVENRIERWVEAFPNSPTPHIAYGMALLCHASTIRGRYAGEVPPDARAQYYRYTQRASDYLRVHRAESSVDPRWYETMVLIARAQGWDEASVRRLVAEATAKEPGFNETYYESAELLLPELGGDLSKIEEFADQAVLLTGQAEGMAMYARIYWHLSEVEFGNKLFTESKVDWPKMKAGFEDIVKQYPDAWNINNYARFACLAQDKDKTKELLSRVGASPVPAAWKAQRLFLACYSWAMGKNFAI